MIYEIRDYTIEEQWFEKYVFWAKNYFMPYAKEKIDIIDFWVYTGLDAEVKGQNPIVSTNGQPNITWVAKYENKIERDSETFSIVIDINRFISKLKKIQTSLGIFFKNRLSLIELLIFVEISFSISRIVFSSIFFDEIKFAFISPFLREINFRNSSIIVSKKNILFFIINIAKKFLIILLKFIRLSIFSKSFFWLSTEYVGFFMKFFKSKFELYIFINDFKLNTTSSV